MQSVLDFFSFHIEIIYIVILSIFLGIEVIGRVPSVLHTPLMSGANAIHGVVVIGAIIVMGKAQTDNYIALILGFLAVVLGTLNVVGGFVVTDRMLEMFKKKKTAPHPLKGGKAGTQLLKLFSVIEMWFLKDINRLEL
jgi:NAD(P) transhydrogenase subunit alpha